MRMRLTLWAIVVVLVLGCAGQDDASDGGDSGPGGHAGGIGAGSGGAGTGGESGSGGAGSGAGSGGAGVGGAGTGPDAANPSGGQGGAGGYTDAAVDSAVRVDSGSGTDASTDPSAALVPPTRRIQWRPGVVGGIPERSVVCPPEAPSVTDFGAVGDGSTDDAPAFVAALEAAAERSAVRIPQGDYLLRSCLTIDNGVVLCGEGWDRSRLLFDCDGIAIDIVKYDRGDWVDVTSGYAKGSGELSLSDASGFGPGDYAEIQQANNWQIMDPENVWRSESWVPENCVGQMVEVVSVDGNTLLVDPTLHLDLDPAFNPQIRRVGLVDGAGLQSLYITRLDTTDNATVQMKNAVNCWMRDCESENTFRSHVGMTSAFRCEVRDSYLHHAHDYGGGGHGYGANLGTHTTDCLLENNIFVHLRHSMLVQVGATGNVFGYNFSTDPIQNEGGDWTPCDISLHGHYPNMNLFEGNTVQEIDISDYWGPCGPGNTFFRNRVQSEGIQVMDYSHGQNILGNELGVAPNVISVDSTVNDTLVHGNYQEGNITWDPDIAERELPSSFYLPSKPAFFQDTPWPVTGADQASGSEVIPAARRYREMP